MARIITDTLPQGQPAPGYTHIWTPHQHAENKASDADTFCAGSTRDTLQTNEMTALSNAVAALKHQHALYGMITRTDVLIGAAMLALIALTALTAPATLITNMSNDLLCSTPRMHPSHITSAHTRSSVVSKQQHTTP